jgi:hypothetical protein
MKAKRAQEKANKAASSKKNKGGLKKAGTGEIFQTMVILEKTWRKEMLTEGNKT